jgi:intracellular multiplication protein IcmO
MMTLTHLRDTGQMRLGVSQIRDYLTLEKVQELAARKDLPARLIDSLQGYLKSLPGYDENPKDGKQGEITTEQHGYLQMQFTRVMSSLADDYGYIFNTTRGEVDFLDVVLNNRILAVLLPSLEKSPEELGNLGKIIVASLKSMMATGLGDRIEGAIAETIHAKATHSPAPFLVILDEYGYYVVPGAAVMPAQARSLNFSMVFAGQDFPSFKKNNNKEEAEATAANCNVYVFMKLRDTTDTAELFSKAVGKARVARISGYSRNTAGIGNSYFDNQNASVQEEERGNLLDLSDQLQGQAHVIFKSAVVRAQMFYAAPPEPKHMRLNHFLRVESPTSAEMASFTKKVDGLRDSLSQTEQLDSWATGMPLPQSLMVADATLTHFLEKKTDPVKAALAALIAAHRLPYANMEAFGQASQKLGSDEDFDGGDDLGITIFTSEMELEHRGQTSPAARGHAPYTAARPRLDPMATRDALMMADIADGTEAKVALQRAEQSLHDLAVTSTYPKNIPETLTDVGFLDEFLGDLDDALEPQENQVREDEDD